MLSKLVAPFRRRLSPGSRRSLPTGSSRPLLEVLEDRLAPATLPTGFSDTQVVSGLLNPTAMEIAPDGRIFVDEQGGNLVVIKNGTLLSTPFASFTVDSTGERGLLGIAFDPSFNTNHYVYVYYTATSPTTHNRVSRLTASTTSDTAVAGSETDLLDLPTLGATNHNGGAIHFGPDGDLYIAVGNNAVNSNSQSLSTPLGKMLRIKPDGSIPTDNPFYNSTTGINQAIWALGLRNPFTFAFQPGTGRMFINDVGENTWEEIDDGIAGSNYGWPYSEGYKQPGDQSTTIGTYRDPLFEYGHGSGNTLGQALVGGTFYNPTTATFPATYSGTYFFEDLVNGWIQDFNPKTGTATGFATGLPTGLVDLDVASDGSLYSLARGSGSNTGTLSQIQYGGGITWTNGDSVTDLFEAQQSGTNSGMVEVNVRDGASGYQTSLAHIVTPLGELSSGSYDLQFAPYNGDGRPDLFVIIRNNTGSGNTEVHVLSAASNYQTWLLHTAIPLPYTGANFEYRLADYDGDGKADLFVVIKSATGSGNTEVHVLSGASNFQTWLLHTAIPLGPTGSNFDFEVGPYKGDGRADLYVIITSGTGSGMTEVHVLSAASGYQTWTLHTATALGPVGANFSFQVADYNGDGMADLIVFVKNTTGSHSAEVHVLDGSRVFQTWLINTGTGLPETTDDTDLDL